MSAGPGYTDEYTLFERLDRLLQECEERGLRMAVVQGGARGADAMAREWVLHNEKISSVPIETIANPNYLVVHRL